MIERGVPAPIWYRRGGDPAPAVDPLLAEHCGRMFYSLRMDTMAIAAALGVQESTAYNALIQYRRAKGRAAK